MSGDGVSGVRGAEASGDGVSGVGDAEAIGVVVTSASLSGVRGEASGIVASGCVALLESPAVLDCPSVSGAAAQVADLHLCMRELFKTRPADRMLNSRSCFLQ